MKIGKTITRDRESRSHLLEPGCLPVSGILNRNWETNSTNREHCSHLLDLSCLPGSGILYRNGKVIFRDQEHSFHLLDLGCLPGSGILYRIWEVISRDQEHGSCLLDLGCLPGFDFTEFRRTISSGYYFLVGAQFPFTGSTQIRCIILELGNNFRGPGV